MIIRRIRAVVGNTALITERGRGNTLVWSFSGRACSSFW